VEKESKQNKPAYNFGRGFLVTVALFLLAGFLRKWFPAIYVAGFLTFCLGLLVYWIPPRPAVPFRSWALKVLQWTALVILVGLLYTFLTSRGVTVNLNF
jgi:hypothetical protein